MKLVDPSIEPVVSGTSLPESSTYLPGIRLPGVSGGFRRLLSTHRYRIITRETLQRF